MSIRSTLRLRPAALALLALVAVGFAAPSALARSSFGISIGVPGLGISYSDYGRHSSWGGYVNGGYSNYGGYYGGAPYYSSYYPAYSTPYYSGGYAPYYRSSYRGHHGYGYRDRGHHGRDYRPSRVVYYDRGDRGHRDGYRGRGRHNGERRHSDHGYSRDYRSSDDSRGHRGRDDYDRDH